MKSHGGANENAFYWALAQAVEEARSGMIQRITEQVEQELLHLNAVAEVVAVA